MFPNTNSSLKPLFYVPDDNQTDTKLEQRSLLETNSSEEEFDATTERNNNEPNGKLNDLKEDALNEAGCDGPIKKEVSFNDGLLTSSPTKSPPTASRNENMIQFDDKLEQKLDAKENLNENQLKRSLNGKRDFLTIDLDDDTEFVTSNISSSLKNNEMINSFNISNISNILNVSNSSKHNTSANQNNKEFSNEDVIDISGDSDEVEIFNKNDHNRTV